MNIKTDVDHLTDRLAGKVDDLRDRTVSAVGAIEDRAITGEMRRLRDRIDRLDDGLPARLADAVESQTSRFEEIARDQSDRFDSLVRGTRRTSWPRRLFWVGIGIAAGAAATYLADPDVGRSRRARLSDQMAATGRDLVREAEQEARYAAGKAKGATIEAAKSALPEDVPADPRTLEERIRSNVFGYREDVQDVVIKVDEPGEVALKGTVPSEQSVDELVSAVRDVDGVIDVRSELVVRGA